MISFLMVAADGCRFGRGGSSGGFGGVLLHVWPGTINLQHFLANRRRDRDNGGMRDAKYSTYELRVRAVQAAQAGMPVTPVAQAYQVNRATVHRWLARVEAGGPDGLRRSPGSGRP